MRECGLAPSNFIMAQLKDLSFRLSKPSMETVFTQLMLERMHEKKLQYGSLEDRFPNEVHAIDTTIQRLQEYINTGNTAHLVDAANFIMIEFTHPSHPIAHMTPLQPGDTPEQILRDANN